VVPSQKFVNIIIRNFRIIQLYQVSQILLASSSGLMGVLCLQDPLLESWWFRCVTPVAGSIFRPLSQTHISKSEFKNGHISRFCSVFQVIQVISSAQFFSAEEVDLSFNSETKEHPQISNPSFWKRDRENVFLQMF